MTTTIATAAPAPLDPIVTPTPLLYWQYQRVAHKKGTLPLRNPIAGTPMRPGIKKGEDAPAPTTGAGDTWQASGCHPTTLCMIAEWIATAPRTSKDLQIPGADAVPAPDARCSLVWAKHLWDSTGDPLKATYESAEAHPPWVPRVSAKQGTEWNVDHDMIFQRMAGLKRAGQALLPVAFALNGSNIRNVLAEAIYQYGPLALNITLPGHFVLLYGVRGRYFYILDPGRSIFNHWAMPDPGLPKGALPDAFSIVPPGRSETDYAIQFFPGASQCHLAIDSEYLFTNVLIRTDTDEKTKEKTRVYSKARFIDHMIRAEGFRFPDVFPFPEFLTAPAPDGRASRQVNSVVPSATAAPPAPSGGSPSATPKGGTTTNAPASGGEAAPKTQPASTQPAAPAADAAPGKAASRFFDALWDWLIEASAPHDGQPQNADAGAPPDGKGKAKTEPPAGDSAEPSNGNANAAPKEPKKAPNAGTRPAAVSHGTITVHAVHYESGAEITGVQVKLLADAKVLGKGSTGDSGWTSKKVPRGRYVVRLQKAAHGAFYGSDSPAEEGSVDVPVELSGDSTEVRVPLVDLQEARLFAQLLELPGRRALTGANVEIVGAFEGTVDAEGRIKTPHFKPGKYAVYAKMPGYGPIPDKAQAPWEGWVTMEQRFRSGDTRLLLCMQKASRTRPPPSSCKRDPLMMKVRGTVTDLHHADARIAPVALRFTHTHKDSEAYGKWTLFDPTGAEVEVNREVVGVGDFVFDSSVISNRAKTPDSTAFGEWTVRLETHDYYDDWNVIYWAALPHNFDDPGRPPKEPLIRNSKIKVGGQDFVNWFNSTMYKPKDELFGCKLGREFHTEFDVLKEITGSDELTLNEFAAHLMAMYNETGGSMRSQSEGDQHLGDRYFFEPKGKKSSYNGILGNKLAGDQLRGWEKISTDEEQQAWNSTKVYPSDAPESVRLAARECDFYRFRGRGLIQLTGRSNYATHADPTLLKLYKRKSADMTNDELDKIFLDPAAYRPMYLAYFQGRSASKLAAVLKGDFVTYGDSINGGGYGKDIFGPRCKALVKAIQDAGYETE